MLKTLYNLIILNFKSYLRQPDALFWLMVFPLILFIFLGLAFTVKTVSVVGTRYIDFLLPGILAFSIMSGTLYGIGRGLIEIRIKKYLKRLTITPISRASLIFSHIFTRMILSFFEISALLMCAYYIFGIKIQGNFLAFIFLLIVGNLSFAGIAVLVGSRTANSVTDSGILNAVMVPMTLVSGIFFSYNNFPKALIPIIKWIPLTILADNMRAVFMEGITLSNVIIPGSILLGMGLIAFALGIKIFKWY